jgi:uncharacterized damage-inducible protein DinB
MNIPSLYASSPVYCHYYFDLVQTDDLLAELSSDLDKTIEFFKSIPTEKEHFAYQEGKWTITQLLRHIIDCERIFAYRALRFARFDDTNLAGFDEDFYMAGLLSKKENLDILIEEFISVRNATISLFETFTDEMLDFHGTANNLKVSARAIGFCVVGHNMHHREVLNQRYFRSDEKV